MFDFNSFHKKIHERGVTTRYIVGVVLIIVGFIALITPFTPGSWLIFVGLEFFGVRLALWDKIKSKFIK